jgi:NAD(P)-dependent dehydrogenase (short-subunit alcohol dehydrogenase family)
VITGWHFEQADVAVEADVARIAERAGAFFGRLDVVVANAGLVPSWRGTEAIDLAEWDRAIGVNVRGVIATIKHAFR